MDSRSLAFADEVLATTNGEGVDIVLNSLAGEAIDKGMSLLRDDGRFLEIGKRDIYRNRRLPMRNFAKNIAFMAIDLDRGLRDRRAAIGALFQSLMKRFESGELKPLPHRVFPISNVVNAFRYMSQAKHIGKVVVSMQDPEVQITTPVPAQIQFRADATYLITGGLGGFGLALARWMADNGARHLVLVGRSGIPSAEAQQAVEAIRQTGAEVATMRADVSDSTQVRELLEAIDKSMPPLRGVMHLAMVLKDTLLVNMNEQQFRDVWRPKVYGAVNLHRQTFDRELDFFVLFSSMTSVFGTGGQGNYASANAVLDALAYERRAHHRPGLSVSWGYLAEVGFVARHDDIANRFNAMGVRSISPREALALLGRLLQIQATHMGVMRLDWRSASSMLTAPRFADLLSEFSVGEESPQQRSAAAVRAALLEAGPDKRREMLVAMVTDQVAKVLGTVPSKLDVAAPFTDLGLDSLMTVELKNWIEGDLRINLPTVELLRGPSVMRLTELILQQFNKHVSPAVGKQETPPTPIESAATPGAAPESADAADSLARVDVESLSESEVDAMLEELGSLEPDAAAS